MEVKVIQAQDDSELFEQIDNFLQTKIEQNHGYPRVSPEVKFMSQSEGPHEIDGGAIKQIITVVILWDYSRDKV